MNTIYRKSSLDKLSSPEQLDKMIHITNTSGWIALLGMFLILLAAGYWAFFGALSEKVSADGIYMNLKQPTNIGNNDVTNETGSFRVLCYVPLSVGKRLQSGMKANILPSTVNEQETGYLLGQVVRIGSYGISQEDMYEKLGDDLLVQAFRSGGVMEPIIEIEIQIFEDDSTQSGYSWSNRRGTEVYLSDFTLVKAYIITKTMTPFKKFTSSIYG